VISDLVMPDCDGIEMIHEIHKEDPNAKILAISGALGGAMLPAAKLLGASAALIKPVSPALLLETVRTVLSS
jgi:two-component system, chemotaxis family, chemotaxis protein CheY